MLEGRTPLGTDCYYGVCYLERIATVGCATWNGLLLWHVLLGADCCCGVCYLERIAAVSVARTWDGLLLERIATAVCATCDGLLP